MGEYKKRTKHMCLFKTILCFMGNYLKYMKESSCDLDLKVFSHFEL